MTFQKTFYDEFTNNIEDFLQFQDSFTVKNSYYKKFYHDFSNFLNDFLQEDFYSLKTDYNLMNNESFNNNAKCYNCDVEFSFNN